MSHCRVYPSLCGKKAPTSLPSIDESGKGVFQPLRECLRGVVRPAFVPLSAAHPSPLRFFGRGRLSPSSPPARPSAGPCPRPPVHFVSPSLGWANRIDDKSLCADEGMNDVSAHEI